MKYVNIDIDGVSLERTLSDHAVCSGCFRPLCMETIFDDTCPYCDTYITPEDIVASLYGKERSAELAQEESSRRRTDALKRDALKRFE